MSKKGTYNDEMPASLQIDMEEAIASALYDYEKDEEHSTNLDETDCRKLSQQILLMVLTKFRPDLVNK